MRIISKDILTVDEGFILHQVNCKGVMGAGLAAQIRQKWSKAYDEYFQMVTYLRENGENILGRYQAVEISENLIVVNIFGQYGYGRDTRYTNYAALSAALGYFAVNYQHHIVGACDLPVYIPMGMGCGLAGGDWDVVKGIIELVLPEAIICKKD